MERIAEMLDKPQLRLDLLRITMMQETSFNGEKQALEKLYKQYWYDWYIDKPDKLAAGIPEPQRDHFRDWLGDFNRKGRWKYLLVTVNPYNDVTFDEFIIKVRKSLKKKYIVNAISCIEWTGWENTDHISGKFTNGGMHYHSRIEIDGKNPYRVRSEFYNTFKGLTSPQCVSVKYSNQAESFIQYIKGFKEGKLKTEMIFCKHYRKYYAIDDVF